MPETNSKRLKLVSPRQTADVLIERVSNQNDLLPLPSSPDGTLASRRRLHLQFAQQKCIYVYMERMYFFNTFLQMHFPHRGLSVTGASRALLLFVASC